MADAELGCVAGVEAGEQNALYIGAAIIIRVGEEKNVGRAGHDDAAVPWKHAVRNREAVGEHGALFESAIAVDVFEQGDDARGRLAFAEADRIPAVFGDEHAALVVERKRDGIANDWLSGHEIDLQTGIDVESSQGLFGS